MFCLLFVSLVFKCKIIKLNNLLKNIKIMIDFILAIDFVRMINGNDSVV